MGYKNSETGDRNRESPAPNPSEEYNERDFGPLLGSGCPSQSWRRTARSPARLAALRGALLRGRLLGRLLHGLLLRCCLSHV